MGESLFAVSEADVASVALPIPVDQLFDYTIPAELSAAARPGCRARVQLGGRPLVGLIVTRERRARPPSGLQPLERVVDPEPALSPALLAVIREAAADALCPLGLAVAAALPPGSAPGAVTGLALTARGREALRAGVLRMAAEDLLTELEAGPRPETWLRKRAGRDAPALLRDLERDGLLERRAIETPPSARPAVERVAALAADLDLAAVRETLKRSPQQAALFELLLGDPSTDSLSKPRAVPVAELRRRIPTAPTLLRALAARGLVKLAERPRPLQTDDGTGEPEREITLNSDQESVLKPITDAVRERRAQTFLLHGVTGSGKTEVYMRAVAEALAAGRQALVLVPEITLTHQILARMRARFGDRLAVLHSGLRPGERLEQWRRLRSGTTPIAVGARSALFAPLENLGLIVLDEEHEGAYRNDEGFRYHARDLARRRARSASCPVVLGSATPSLESRYGADRGELERLVLPRRIGGVPLPGVEIVDLARERERLPRGTKLVLSPPLVGAMSRTLDEGGQVILLLNRRGFSTQILCFQCGHGWRCSRCDIALVYHSTQQVLRCHYCDFQMDPPDTCPSCGAPDAALLGIGTERVEEEVRTRFPEARLARLDRDTAARRGHTASVLRALRDGELDVLIGTQLVAKGHDFPGVRLVGVVLADVGLHLPDFRAAERTFQLLTQVAGRAGRDRVPGKVLIQTFSADHYAIRPVREHDYETFYAEELSKRAELGYPPFGRLARIVVSSEHEREALRGAETLADRVRAEPGVDVLGPAPAPLARLRGRYRQAFLLKGKSAEPVRAAAAILSREAARLPQAISASVDIDPLNML